MSRPLFRSMALLLVPALVTVACGDDDDAGTSDPPAASSSTPASDGGEEGAAVDGEPIRIGALLSLTGSVASLGEQQRDALEMLVEQVNADGGIDGRPVELEVLDDHSTPDRGVEQMRALLSEFDPHAVIGPTVGAVCGATKPVTEEAEVVQYCMSAAPIPDPAPFYFSAQSSLGRLAGDVPAHWMVENGYQTIACMASDDTSGQNYLSAMQAAGSAAGVEVISENFNLEDVDISAQLTRLRDQDPDAVYACTTGTGVVTILQGMQQLGFDVPTWVGSGSASLALAETVADLLPSSGAFTGGEKIQVISTLDESDPQYEAITEFAEAFEAEFGYAPDYFAASAADAFALLTEAIAAAGDDPDAAAIVAELEAREPYTGIQLTYDFTPDDHRGTNLSGIVTRFTEDGGFELVDSFDEVPTYSAQ